VEVGTNRKGYRELAKFSDTQLDFENLDFAAMSFFGEKRMSVPVSEKEKDWIEKQISLYSDKFRSPIGVYSISYRYRLRGRIKKTKV
jgi:hypothetical protein